MQFQFNSDYPGVKEAAAIDGSTTAASTTYSYTPVPAVAPLQFPPAHPLPCARITTRVYHPSHNQVATVHNVLVPTAPAAAPLRVSGRGSRQHRRADDPHHSEEDVENGSINSHNLNSSDSSMITSDEDEDVVEDENDFLCDPHPSSAPAQPQHAGPDRAYWLQRTIRDAIYGRVVLALILRRTYDHAPAEWLVTTQAVAVKEMSWQHIRRERDRLAEDPITEVAAMQYLVQTVGGNSSNADGKAGGVTNRDGGYENLDGWSATNPPPPQYREPMESLHAVLRTNIMMPLELLSDDGHLYSIMPYCNGGELFDRLDLREKFSEDEARYWMAQILNGIESLQHAGICHRDISLENLLVHETGALIIDLGMCLRIPHYDDAADPNQQLSTDMEKMSMENEKMGALAKTHRPTSLRKKPRYLITPQGTCGKWIYMSPEVYRNSESFDGYAVDMWAAGVILFLMLTGFPPWERACMTDERFKYMSAGYLVPMLTEWNLGLSADAMDLLQRMLFLDPRDRLSLDQVRHHPWMVSGLRIPPSD